MGKEKRRPIVEQSAAYSLAFEHLNGELFGGALEPCMLVLSRNSESIGGYFSPNRWANEEGAKVIHEIGINANRMKALEIHELFGKMVHEMVHLFQFQKGSAGRVGYHNQEFVSFAEGLGLKVEGGGQAVSTSVVDGGKAAMAIASLPDEAIWPWLAASSDACEDGGGGQTPPPVVQGPKKSGKRQKYCCPVCGLNAWARFGASLICGECSQVMTAVGGQEEVEE